MDNLTVPTFLPIPPANQQKPKWETTLPSHSFLFVVNCIECFCSAITLISFGLLMYVIIRCSPKQMGTYKYFLLLNAAHCLVIDVWMALFQPEGLAPHPVIVIRGLANYMNKDVVAASVFVVVTAISGTGFTTVYLFVFRFLQTTDHFLQRYVSLFRVYWCVYAIWTVIVSTFVITPWLINCTLTNDYIVVWVQFDEELVRRVRSGISMGLISNNNTRWQSGIGVISVCAIIGSGFVVILFSSIGVYRFLQFHIHSLSTQTLELYRSLMRALLIEVIVSHCAAGIGFSLILLAMNLHLYWGPVLCAIAFPIASSYGLIVHIVILFNIRPYREGVLLLFRKLPLCGHFVPQRINQIVPAVSTSYSHSNLVEAANNQRLSISPVQQV